MIRNGVEFNIIDKEKPCELTDKTIRYLIRNFIYGFDTVTQYKEYFGRTLAPFGGKKPKEEESQ